MEAHHGSRGDVTVEAFDLSGTPEESPASEEALAVAAAATRQRDPCVLAEWYCERARELDARAGQLRYASVMCELGAARVFVGDDGAGGDDFDAERVFEVGDRQAVVELLRLRSLLRHMCSLVRQQRQKIAVAIAAVAAALVLRASSFVFFETELLCETDIRQDEK